MARSPNLGPYRGYYAAYMLREHGVDKAIEALSAEDGFDYSLYVWKANLLALTPEGFEEAERVLKEVVPTDDVLFAAPEAAWVSVLLGNRERAREILERAEANPVPFYRTELLPLQIISPYLLENASDDELLAEVETPEQESFAHCLIAMKCLIDRKWDDAERHFDISANCSWPFGPAAWHLHLSAAYLAQMQRDPNWPVGRASEN